MNKNKVTLGLFFLAVFAAASSFVGVAECQTGSFSIVPSFGQQGSPEGSNNGASNSVLPGIVGGAVSGIFNKQPSAGSNSQSPSSNSAAPQGNTAPSGSPSSAGNGGGGTLPIEAKQLMDKLMGYKGEGSAAVGLGTVNLIKAAESAKTVK